MSTRWLALLRGINLGSTRKLPMKTLVGLFEAAGAREVRTHLQTGNVVFEAPKEQVRGVLEEVRAGIARELGFDCPMALFGAEELARVVAGNPYAATEAASSLHVAFLMDAPSEEAAASLDPARSPPDTFAVAGRAIYLRCPNGLARTRLTNAWFDAQLKTVSTVRTWRVTLKLASMMGLAVTEEAS
jgi:uncharacterized protein (DUF1697 family)